MTLEQPKKPVDGAYGIVLTEKRPEFTKACAGQKASAVSSMAGESWKKLNEEATKLCPEGFKAAFCC